MADLAVVLTMRIAVLLALLLLAAACSQQPGTQPTPSGAQETPSAASSEGVAVTLTGTPVMIARGVEWCPANHLSADCAGIPVTGLSDDAIEVFARSQVWQVDGVYDGATLRATGAPEPVDYTEPDLTTPCEDLRGRAPGPGDMDSAAGGVVAGYLATIPERYAATWWDEENGVATVLLTGDDVAEDRAALKEVVRDRVAVCVVGGARWSEADLDRAQSRAFDIAREEGMGPWSASKNVVANRVELDVERSDQATVARIEREAGEAVQVRALIAVRDATLDELPDPPSRGDVELETAPTRGGAGMGALTAFTLRLDEQNGCVYGEVGQGRTGLMWPFGYYAESDPLRVYDHRGQLVAQEGDRLESGGGEIHRDRGVCGASEIWIMSGRPNVVGSSEG